MKTSIDRIKDIIFARKHVTAKQLHQELEVSQVLIHRHLKALCQKGIIQKVGSSPKVFYIPFIKENLNHPSVPSDIISENWLEIRPNGKFLYGKNGFSLWCQKRGFDPNEKQNLFEQIFLEKENIKNNGLIDATKKIKASFQKSFLEKMWYIDFYSWEIFGKTLLGKLILYAKQNSDLILMKKIAKIIEKPLLNLIGRENFDMIGLIPHSISRKSDFLQTTLNFLDLKPKPKSVFKKVFLEHVVAQKTLKSKEDRQKNAEETLFLNMNTFPNKILLIDDACGSGSTLNIAAKKISKISPSTKIYGITFVGSIKGFDVINDS